MRSLAHALVWALAAAGCRSGPPAWERAPLGPPLRLGEAVAPGEVLVLAVDAHGGGALAAGVGAAQLARLAEAPRGPGGWVARTDSAGRLRFRGVPAGTYELRVRGMGYADWREPVTVGAGAGWVGVAQLRRREVRLETVIVGPARP